MLITTMHDHTIDYYFYPHNYLFFCALQVINNTPLGQFKLLGEVY